MIPPMTIGYKVLTHDYRPPVQGGDPVWDGKRKTLPKVTLDTGPDDCGAGWNFCADAPTALRIAGLWPDGRPSILLLVKGSVDTIERGDKLRCSKLTILDRCSEDDVRVAVMALSLSFGEHSARMADSQMMWRSALARPERDDAAVEAGLVAALGARGLVGWTLRRFDAAWAAWAARDAWDAWDAWDGRAARAALTVEYAALAGWTQHDPLMLTTGLRDAYAHGLTVAVPVDKNVLGWTT